MSSQNPLRTICRTALLVLVLGCQALAVDDVAVQAAIRRGVDALLEGLREEDFVEYRRGEHVATVTGTVTKDAKDDIFITTTDGKKFSIPKESIRIWRRAGLVHQEMEAPYYTGPSTLAALALAVAGVETTQPKMQRLLDILEDGPGAKGGTYVHSLRANLWSALLDRTLGQNQRARYKKLLKQDVDWLTQAARPSGWYTYTAAGNGGDHSNTQFANLGLWAGSIGKIEVANKHWQSMAKHWLESQNADGGWSYASRPDMSTSSMTVAGCNSLYIALDRFYARPEASYRLFEGILQTPAAKDRIRQMYAAIERGDVFLQRHPPNPASNNGYELFGLERLGLASGQSHIGGQDWFAAYAGAAANRPWGTELVGDAFATIFLVHGQAPILIQKLEHGRDVEDWNYYQRDIHSLTRYLNRTFERLHRWQRLPVNAALEDIEDAPILYIAGQSGLELPDSTWLRIRRYIDAGGTVFLHADRASRKFSDSATRAFEELLAEEEGRFETLEDSHPLYRCLFGGAAQPWKRVVSLKAIRDGARLQVILCPVDIAGAWQQDRGPFEELFKIMANVRVYCAPPYAELPRRLRAPSRQDAESPLRGALTVARPHWPGCFTAHPKAWAKYREISRRRTGIDLIVKSGPPDFCNWPAADVVHVSLRADPRPSESVASALQEYVRAGGLLIVDAGDGQSADISAVRDFVDRIGVGERTLLPANHPIVVGTLPGARPLGELERTEAGAGLSHGLEPPPIITRMIDGRPAVLACPFDLTAGLDGCFIWNRCGYRPDSTRRIMDNILAWRWQERQESTNRKMPP